MRFQGVLFASDFDGTLVPSDKRLRPAVLRAIHFFIQNGGYFTLATGRHPLALKDLEPCWFNAPALLVNGGMLYDFSLGRPVEVRGIGPKAAPLLGEILQLFPQLSMELYGADQCACIHPNPLSLRHFTSQQIPFRILENPERGPFPLAKIMLTGAPEEIARVQSFLKGRETPLHFLPTDGCFLELLAPEVDKGTGLMRLAQRLGVAPEHVYAAGDGYNDAEMLRAARLAFVPEDGDSAALACAGKRIPSCEKDGIVRAIEILSQMYPA